MDCVWVDRLAVGETEETAENRRGSEQKMKHGAYTIELFECSLIFYGCCPEDENRK